jgi:hypothetical protein
MQDLRAQVKRIVDSALALQAMDSRLHVVAFVDEFNTTSLMGALKEIFVDMSLDGISLPSNIFWVAAMNPFDDKNASDAFNFTGT